MRLSTLKCCLCLALINSTFAENLPNTAEPAAIVTTISKKKEASIKIPLLDSSHSYLINRADNIAAWMDSFFGEVQAEEDAPYSTLRLRLDQQWEEHDSFNYDTRFRGKVYLPKLNKKVSLIFSDDEHNNVDTDDIPIEDSNESGDVSLQYTAKEKKHYRISFKAGLRSSLDPKFSARYHYENNIARSLIGTFSEEVSYRGGDGFGSRTLLKFDKIITPDDVIRWHNRLDWREEISGISWLTGLSLNKRLSNNKALSYFSAVRGETHPSDFIHTYSIGVSYKQNIFRPWLFLEARPGYNWTKTEPGVERDGYASFLLRIAIVFHRDFSRSNHDILSIEKPPAQLNPQTAL